MKIACDVCLKSVTPDEHGNSETTCNGCRVAVDKGMRLLIVAINRLTAAVIKKKGLPN